MPVESMTFVDNSTREANLRVLKASGNKLNDRRQHGQLAPQII